MPSSTLLAKFQSGAAKVLLATMLLGGPSLMAQNTGKASKLLGTNTPTSTIALTNSVLEPSLRGVVPLKNMERHFKGVNFAEHFKETYGELPSVMAEFEKLPRISQNYVSQAVFLTSPEGKQYYCNTLKAEDHAPLRNAFTDYAEKLQKAGFTKMGEVVEGSINHAVNAYLDSPAGRAEERAFIESYKSMGR